MVYRAPALAINQNLELTQSSEVAPLFATIVGPRYELHRFDVTSEQAEIGEYDPVPASTVYTWPDHIAGGVIDLDTASVVVQNALLVYNEQTAALNVTEDNGNSVKSSTGFVWKTNSAASRDSSLGTRDVQVGDTALITWNSGGDTLQSLVAGFVAEVVAGTTNAPTRVTGDGDTAEGATETIAAPTKYTIVYDATAYNGLADGYPSDSYTIQVLVVGTGTDSGGTLDNTKLYITSAGNDTATTVTLDDSNWNGGTYDVAFGDRGATFTIVDAGGGTVEVGDTWAVTYAMDYSETVVTNPAEFDLQGSPSYDGSKNTQYIVTVSAGGVLGTDAVTFSITTNNAADSTATVTSPTTDWPAASNAYPFGNNDMVLTLFTAADQYNTGDVITVDATAPTEGAIETLVLRDSVAAVVADDLDIKLMAEQTATMDTVYATLTQDNITISANATATVNILGTETAHAIFYGIMYADYRELDTVVANKLEFISSITDVGDTLGAATPDNPLALGVSYALNNANGTGCYFIATNGDTYSAYETAFDVLTQDRVIYGLVPLTNDEDIKNLLVAHVNEMSTSENNQWRLGWLMNPEVPITGTYVEQSNGADLQITIADIGPGLNDFRAFTIQAGNLQANGVKPGDAVRTNYSTDAMGNVTYDEYTIDSITDEQNGKLLTGPPAAIAVPIKAEFWRTLTNSEYADALAAYPAQYNNRRIRCVWADNPTDENGNSIDIFYYACGLAGLRSGVAPHQPLSTSSLVGVEMDPVYLFGKSDTKTIAGGGNWLVTKDPSTAAITTFHQLTTYTDPDELAYREDTITTNGDYIARDLYNNLDDLYGQGNVSEAMEQIIRTRIHVRSSYIIDLPYSDKIGPQITDYEIISVGVHPTLKDTMIVNMDYTLPSPLNVLTVNMNIGVG